MEIFSAVTKALDAFCNAVSVNTSTKSTKTLYAVLCNLTSVWTYLHNEITNRTCLFDHASFKWLWNFSIHFVYVLSHIWLL